MEENITNFEIASSPEELQASMDRESQTQTEAPVQEEVQEQVEEPVQDTPYVDPDAAPAEPHRFRLSKHNKKHKSLTAKTSRLQFSIT